MGDEMRERERASTSMHWCSVCEYTISLSLCAFGCFSFERRRNNGILMQWCNAGVVLHTGRLAERGVVVFLPCCFTGAAPGCWTDLHSNGQLFRKKRPSLFPLYVLFSYCGLARFVCFSPSVSTRREGRAHTNMHKYESLTQYTNTRKEHVDCTCSEGFIHFLCSSSELLKTKSSKRSVCELQSDWLKLSQSVSMWNIYIYIYTVNIWSG